MSPMPFTPEDAVKHHFGIGNEPGQGNGQPPQEGWRGWAQRQDRLRKFDGTDPKAMAFAGQDLALARSLARGPTFEPGTPQLDAGLVASMPAQYRTELEGDIRAGAQRTVDASKQTPHIDPGALQDAQRLLGEGAAGAALRDDPAVRQYRAFGPDTWRPGAMSYSDAFRMLPFQLTGGLR